MRQAKPDWYDPAVSQDDLRALRRQIADLHQERARDQQELDALWHFLLTWLKKEAIDDALIQPYSGHSNQQSLKVYSRLSLADAQAAYDAAMERFPV